MGWQNFFLVNKGFVKKICPKKFGSFVAKYFGQTKLGPEKFWSKKSGPKIFGQRGHVSMWSVI